MSKHFFQNILPGGGKAGIGCADFGSGAFVKAIMQGTVEKLARQVKPRRKKRSVARVKRNWESGEEWEHPWPKLPGILGLARRVLPWRKLKRGAKNWKQSNNLPPVPDVLPGKSQKRKKPRGGQSLQLLIRSQGPDINPP